MKIARLEPIEIRPVVGGGLAGAGRFHVEDDAHPGIDGACIDCAAGLEKYGTARVDQCGHERVNLGLEQRFSAGDLDQAIALLQNPLHYLAHRQHRPFGEGVGGIAVPTAQVAAGQAHEHAGQPGVRALPLQAPVDLMDDERSGRPACDRTESPLECAWTAPCVSRT